VPLPYFRPANTATAPVRHQSKWRHLPTKALPLAPLLIIPSTRLSWVQVSPRPPSTDQAGLYQLRQLLAANKLKVFASLTGFLAEYRIGDEQSPLVLCCRSLVLNRDLMRTKPVRRSDDMGPPTNWMG
jgi:hypothetical protein